MAGLRSNPGLLSVFSLYVGKQYLFNFLILFCGLLSIVYVFDTVELLRRASAYPNLAFGHVIQMSFLKLPEVGQLLFPFAVLFSAMFTIWKTTRTHELVIARSIGLSAWQFLAPLITVAVLIGVLKMILINPVSAVLLSKYENMEVAYLNAKSNRVAISQSGLWLRQADHDSGDYTILYAAKIKHADWALRDVIVFFFDENDQWVKRYDAGSARLDNGYWVLNNIEINDHQGGQYFKQEEKLPTDLTINEIEESYATPQTVSFWRLPEFIRLMEETGFPTIKLRIHYQSLWAQPLLFAAMVLLAASVALRPPRQRGTTIMISLGIMIGFLVFFLDSFLQAFGISQKIPVLLAAWSPALVSFLLGLAALLYLEDG